MKLLPQPSRSITDDKRNRYETWQVVVALKRNRYETWQVVTLSKEVVTMTYEVVMTGKSLRFLKKSLR